MKICKNFVRISRIRALADASNRVARMLESNGEHFSAVDNADIANALNRLADIEEAVAAFPKQLPPSLDEWNDFARNSVAFVRELQTTREVVK